MRFYRHWRNLVPLTPQEKLAYVLVRVQEKMKTARVSKRLKKVLCTMYLAIGRPLPLFLRSFYILQIYRQAVYVPQRYTGRALLIKGEKRSYHPHFDWRELIVGELEMQEVSCNHSDIIKEEFIQCWAETLKMSLHKAQLRERASCPA